MTTNDQLTEIAVLADALATSRREDQWTANEAVYVLNAYTSLQKINPSGDVVLYEAARAQFDTAVTQVIATLRSEGQPFGITEVVDRVGKALDASAAVDAEPIVP